MRRDSFLIRLICEILNSPGLMNYGPVEFYNRSIVQRSFIGPAHPLDDFALARVIAERYPRFLLRLSNLQGQPRPLVKQAQRLAVKRVNSRTPIINAHLDFLFYSVPVCFTIDAIVPSVIAPRLLLETRPAYLANTPRW